jgi:hypothetical protein
MKNKNIHWIIAGVVSALTFIIHLTMGQVDLVNPLMESELTIQVKTEFLAVWHLVSVVLLVTPILYFYYGFKNLSSSLIICLLSNLYLAFGIVFILAGIYNSIFVPQWILLLPIGFFGLLGIKKHSL